MDKKSISFCVGIDICPGYTQISYFDNKSNNGEPVVVEFINEEDTSKMSLHLAKMAGRDEWLVGEQAVDFSAKREALLIDDLTGKAIRKETVNLEEINYRPIELWAKYFEILLEITKKSARVKYIDKICVTFSHFGISILNVIKKALKSLDYEDDQLLFACHMESYIYYVIKQSPELWKNDIVLFEYDKEGLKTHRFYIANGRGNRIVMTHSDDFTEDLPYSVYENGAHGMDALLTAAARQVLEKKDSVVSSVLLTGECFMDSANIPNFIRYVCNRRRVFAEQNLFAKGACYQAMAEEGGLSPYGLLLACPERITTGIEMKITDHGREKIFRLIKPGINWYLADCSYDFIVDNMTEIEIFLSPVDSNEKQLVKIPLDTFPLRSDKSMRITIAFSFTGDSRCQMMVTDKGFGEFFPSSGRIINEDLLL